MDARTALHDVKDYANAFDVVRRFRAYGSATG
jgi:hypothetical protein